MGNSGRIGKRESWQENGDKETNNGGMRGRSQRGWKLKLLFWEGKNHRDNATWQEVTWVLPSSRCAAAAAFRQVLDRSFRNSSSYMYLYLHLHLHLHSTLRSTVQ